MYVVITHEGISQYFDTYQDAVFFAKANNVSWITEQSCSGEIISGFCVDDNCHCNKYQHGSNVWR